MSKKKKLSQEDLELVGGGIAIWHKSFDTNANSHLTAADSQSGTTTPLPSNRTRTGIKIVN